MAALERAQQLFQKYDHDGNREFQVEEVQELLHDFGYDESNEYAWSMALTFDKNGDGILDVDDFGVLHQWLVDHQAEHGSQHSRPSSLVDSYHEAASSQADSYSRYDPHPDAPPGLAGNELGPGRPGAVKRP
jgi:hypothetical protein